jgi:acyl-CoA thioesterase-1
MLRLFLWLAIALWSGVAVADKPVLLVLGDSLSAAYGMDAAQGWVALLQKRVSAQGFSQRVVNASVSGETTSGGRARLPALLKQHRPAIVVIALGANDGLRGLPVDQMQRNLQAMTDAARKSGARVLLAGIRLPPNYGAAYAEQFQRVYRDLARSRGVALVPFLLEGVDLDDNLMQADRLHPAPAAQARILDNVWPALQPLLGKP